MGPWNSLLDKSVVFSFDRNGYKRHSAKFAPSDLDVDLSGHHALITGANSGIGYATARALMSRGAHVTIVGRNPQRVETAAGTLRQDSLGGTVSTKTADVSSLSDINDLANSIERSVSILIHNAGDMLSDLTHTQDGFETITATHLLGPYALTLKLRDANLFSNSAENPARVIFVSSGGMYTQRLDVDTLMTPKTPYDGMVHYALTKRGQVALSEILDNQLRTLHIRSVSMHPGWVDTPAVQRAMPKFYQWTRRILRTPEQGADTVIWLAIKNTNELTAESGFYFDRRPAPLHRLKKTRHPSSSYSDLLEFMETATGLKL